MIFVLTCSSYARQTPRPPTQTANRGAANAKKDQQSPSPRDDAREPDWTARLETRSQAV
jgi:hypothetical protein